MNKLTTLIGRYSTDPSIVAQKHPLTDDDTGILSFLCADGSWKHLVMSADPKQIDIAYEVHCIVLDGVVIEVTCTCEDFKYRHRACKHIYHVGVRMFLLNDDLWYIASLRRAWKSADAWRRADELERRMTIWKRETVKGTAAA
jgi:SWIM zinc finger